MSGMVSGGLAKQTDPPAGLSAAGGSTLRAQLSPVEFALFASFGVRRRLAADQVLFRRGDLCTSMYIIVSGAICLDFGPGLPAKQLAANDFFGELAMLMERHPRSSDARASCETLLIELTQEGFEQLIEQDPAMVVFFLRRTVSRVVGSEQRLIGQLSAGQSLQRHPRAQPHPRDGLQRRSHRAAQPPLADRLPAALAPFRAASAGPAADRLR